MGGLHDYISTLSNKQLVEYIMNKAKDLPELDSADKLNELVTQYGIKNDSHNVGVQGPMGGLHDFIFRIPREQVSLWALAAEKFHRDATNKQLLGGLHDYIDTLETYQIAEYVLKEAGEHEELNTTDFLNGLVDKYQITLPTPHNMAVFAEGGLHDFIWREERDTLVKWALAAEQHHRNVNDLQLLGGLHDYISTLTNEQVVDYILQEAAEHPELNTAKFLNDLVKQYSITAETH